MTIQADTYFSIIPEWVLYGDVSAQAVRVYGVLRRYADQDGKCHPSRRTIAQRCRTSVATIDRALQELIDLAAVTVEHRTVEAPNGNRHNTSNRYTVHSLPARREGGWTASEGTRTAGDATPTLTGDEQTKAILNESQEPEFPPQAEMTPEVTEVFSARTVAAHWADTFLAVHGERPVSQSVKRVAQAAKQLIDEGRNSDVLLSAAAHAATGGHANLASSVTYLLARNKTHGREPRGFDGIREFLADERSATL